MNNTASRSTSSHPVFRRIVLLLLAFLLVLAAAGFLYENISEARDRRFNPMGGRRVDVGGRKMHIDCTGDGSPTVILDSGLGRQLSFVAQGAAANRQVHPRLLLRPRRTRL